LELIALLDFFSLSINILSLLVLITKWKKKFSTTTKAFLLLALTANLIYNLSNFMEWSNISLILVPIEDYIQMLTPLSWLFFIYAVVQDLNQNKLRRIYKDAELYKDLFTHDINNIFQSILSANEYLDKTLKKEEKQKDYFPLLKIIYNQVSRGKKLTSDIIKLSKLKGSNELKPVKIYPILCDTINHVKETFKSKNISIDIQISDKDVKILANKFIRDLFENILNNSVKHNQNQDILVKVIVKKYPTDNEQFIKISFIDNGIGISDAMKELLFSREINKSKMGMGLGLFLVKQIVDLYNGKIWIENRIEGKPSKGSKFNVVFPILEED